VTSFRLIGAAAAASTALLALATRSSRVQRLDDALEELAGRHRERLLRVASIGTLLGENYAHPTMGAFLATLMLVLRPGGSPWRALVPLACASLGAILAHHAVKLFYRRPRPAIALSRNKLEPAFPSGHTADATAVLATGAYLLVREGIIAPTVIIPVAALLAFVTGLSRVALGWHWGSDVIGGWLTGLGVAAGCAGVYEMLRAAAY
jgi:membrane-associated phospholipid phosphatase